MTFWTVTKYLSSWLLLFSSFMNHWWSVQILSSTLFGIDNGCLVDRSWSPDLFLIFLVIIPQSLHFCNEYLKLSEQYIVWKRRQISISNSVNHTPDNTENLHYLWWLPLMLLLSSSLTWSKCLIMSFSGTWANTAAMGLTSSCKCPSEVLESPRENFSYP